MRDPFEGVALPSASKRAQPPDALPVSRLGAAQVPLAHRFDAWHEACAPLFDSTCLGDPGRFDVGAISYLVDRLVFTRVHFERMHFSRGAPHLSSGESDCISVQYYRSGSITGRLDDGTPLHMAPDRISVQDFAHAYAGVGETTESFGVIIPRHLLTGHDHIYRHGPMFSWALDSPQGRLLTSALAAIWRELPLATRSESAAIASGFLGLVNGLLAAEPAPGDRGAVEPAALRAMQDHLRANVLQRRDVCVADLCREFHCSRATLYRLFQPYGGVKAYQRGLRLEGAFRDLALARGSARGRVSTIAERWGFSNLSHFHRSFKQRFDLSPSDILPPSPLERGGPLKPDTTATHLDDVTRLRGWLERY
jgi:AraC-like DNA-binding protein